jgi:hypothetical protein
MVTINTEEIAIKYAKRIRAINTEAKELRKKGRKLDKRTDDFTWYCLDLRALMTEQSVLKKVLSDLTGKIYL